MVSVHALQAPVLMFHQTQMISGVELPIVSLAKLQLLADSH